MQLPKRSAKLLTREHPLPTVSVTARYTVSPMRCGEPWSSIFAALWGIEEGGALGQIFRCDEGVGMDCLAVWVGDEPARVREGYS